VEEVNEKAKATPTWQITVVTDMSGLSSRHLYRPGLKYFAETEKMVEDYYPELLYHVHIIRPPRIFNLIYGMVKHAFDPVTRAKFEMVPGDALAHLAAHMDKVRHTSASMHTWGVRRNADAGERMAQAMLPTVIGGPTEYKDPRQLCFGGPVPENLYKTNDETFMKVTVGASSVHVHKQVVDQAGATLVWDFFTEEHDISFGVYHVPEAVADDQRDKHTPLVPIDRVNSHTDKCGRPHAQCSPISCAADPVPEQQHERAGGPGQAGRVPPGVGQLVLVDAQKGHQLQGRRRAGRRGGLRPRGDWGHSMFVCVLLVVVRAAARRITQSQQKLPPCCA
jgi:hypothetical protein